MKNKKIFGFIIAGLVAAFLAGCSDINGTKTSAKESGIYTVRGSLSFSGSSGAAPAAFISSKSDARTATASFDEVSDFEWTINAYPYDVDGAVNKDKSYKADFENGSFSVKVPSVGEYLVEARLENDGLLYAEGSTNVIVSESAEENTSATITASPKASSVLGKVSLPVKLDSASASLVDNVEVIWRDTNFDVIMNNLGYDWEKRSEDGSEAEDVSDPLFSDFPLAGQDEEVKNNVRAFFDWYKRMTNGELDKTFNFDSTAQTEISYDDIFTGSHSVTINFNDELGNTLYSRKEVINVYSGFTTDTWYGSDLAEGLSITGENIERYGTEVVPNTDIVLYSASQGEDSSETNFDFYVTNTSDSNLESPFAELKLTDYIVATPFCFDSDGNFYLLEIGSSTSTLKSNKSGWTEVTLNGGGTGTGEVSSITIDIASNTLYFVHQTEAYASITQYPNLISSNGTDTETNESITLNYSGSEWLCSGFVRVYAGKIFALYGGSGDYTVAIGNIDDKTSDGLSYSKTVAITLPDGATSSLSVTDMLYQDGCIYLLARDSSTYFSSSSPLTSRGAVIKFDTITGKAEQCGWTSETLANTNFAAGGDYSDVGMYLSEDSAGENMLYTDATLSSPAILYGSDKILFGDNLEGDAGYIASKFPSICTPAPLENELSSDSFYGPKRFVAIKPKKLVIADDGFAIYTNSDGALTYKNVNRIVYVDLEKFSISKTENTNAKFEADIESMAYTLNINNEVGTNYYKISNIDSDKQLYYRDSSTDEAVSGSTGCNGKYFYIPCTDAE